MRPQMQLSAATDRVSRAGGTVKVNPDGSVSLTSLSGQAVNFSGHLTPGANDTYTVGTSGARASNVYSVLGNFSGALTASGGGALTGTFSGAPTFSGAAVVSGLWSFTNTGTYAFSGPIRTNAPDSEPAQILVNRDTTTGRSVIRGLTGGAGRWALGVPSGGGEDFLFFTGTGSAGSETFLEGFRLLNSGSHVRLHEDRELQFGSDGGAISRVAANNLQVSASWRPSTDNARALGASGNRWSEFWTAICIASGTPGYVRVAHTGAAADAKSWRMTPQSDGGLLIETINDALNSTAAALTFSRTGNTPTLAAFSVPVSVDRSSTGVAFQLRNPTAIRHSLNYEQASTADAVWRTAAGAAGAESFTEALRLINADGKVRAVQALQVGASDVEWTRVSANLAQITAGIRPSTDNARDLGGASNRWSKTYTTQAVISAGTVGSGSGLLFGSQASLYSDVAGVIRARNGADSGYVSLDLLNIDVLRGGNINSPAGVNILVRPESVTRLTVSPTGITVAGVVDATGTGTHTFSGAGSFANTLTLTTTATYQGAAGIDVTVRAQDPTQTADAQAGKSVTVSASGAVAGNTNAGAAAGGALTLNAGNAARLTSGDANGGDVTLNPGAGIGTGLTGYVVIPRGILAFVDKTNLSPALKRSSTVLQIRLADDSGYAPIDASLVQVAGTQVLTSQQAAIADADGTLADITTKFNTWLSHARTHGLIAA